MNDKPDLADEGSAPPSPANAPQPGVQQTPPVDAAAELYVRIWEKAVDTQMHFNEMSVKSRQLGLTFVVGALALAVILIRTENNFTIKFGIEIPITSVIIIAAAFALLAVRQLDLGVYHKMLRGAVTFGEDFERQYMSQVFDLDKGMTETISHYSRFGDASKTEDEEDGRYRYTGNARSTAQRKIEWFYWGTFGFLILLGVALLAQTNWELIEAMCEAPTTEANP